MDNESCLCVRLYKMMCKPGVYWLILVLMIVLPSCKNNSVSEDTISNASENDVDVVHAGMLQAIKDDPSNASIWEAKSRYLYEHEKYDEALQDIEQAIALDSTVIDYQHLKADIQLDYYKSREAIATLQQILLRNPNRIPTLLKLSEFQHILKNYDASIQTINDVIRLQSYNAEAYFMLGMNFRELNDIEKAKASFQRAVELDADLTDGWIILGNMYEAEKNKQALQYYNSAVSSNPRSIAALHSKAFYLQNDDDILGAIQIYRQINQLDPQYEDAYLNTGILYLSIDSLQQAKEHFNILRQINPANPFAFYYTGLTEEYLGNLDRAKASYSTALRLKPDYTKAQEALAGLK